MHFVDREAKYPNRWTMKKSDGTSEVVTLVRNDEPIVEGTPMNAETLNTLSDVAGADIARIAAEKAASTATAKAGESAASAEASESSASAAAISEANAKKYSEEAGAKANTDKTLSIENAPADAAATRALIKEMLAQQREEDNSKIKFWASDDPTSPASFIGGTWERIEDCTIWGASSIHPSGTKLEAGLPNITGTVSTRALKSGYETGVFLTQGKGALKSVAVDSIEEFINLITTEDGPLKYGGSLSIDASLSNPVYGASNTVQPPAYCLYLWRRVE